MFRLWLLDLRIVLGDDYDHVVSTHCGLYGSDGTIPSHNQRRHHMGEDNRIPQRQEREVTGDILFTLFEKVAYVKEVEIEIVAQCEPRLCR
jgi:hypothetical protein